MLTLDPGAPLWIDTHIKAQGLLKTAEYEFDNAGYDRALMLLAEAIGMCRYVRQHATPHVENA